MEKPSETPFWQVLLGLALFVLVMATTAYGLRTPASDCMTDYPKNVVLCVDTGQGHHTLMETLVRPH